MTNYYDYAASTPVSSSTLKAMQKWHSEFFANASSSHFNGRKASEIIVLARESIAKKISAMPSEIIFTSGATESNNMAIKGIAYNYLEKKGHIITSAIEHKSILNTCNYLKNLGFEVTYLEPTATGAINPENVLKAIKNNTLIISLHHVNNELGTIQEITEIGEIAFNNQILFHVDAAQSFCKPDINVDDMNIDLLSISAHKIYGPKGVGVLYVRNARNANLIPLIHGGGQELGLRGGTLATALIVGLASAVESFPKEMSQQQHNFHKSIKNYDFIRNGGNKVVDTIWNVTFSSDTEAKRFINDQNWQISQGSACNTLSNMPSHVLKAIGLTTEEARRTFRISLPPYYKKANLTD